MQISNNSDAQAALRILLNSEIGKKAAESIKNSSAEEVARKISATDKTSVAEKLKLLGMPDFAEKIKSVNQAELVKTLSENPEILKNLLK